MCILIFVNNELILLIVIQICRMLQKKQTTKNNGKKPSKNYEK